MLKRVLFLIGNEQESDPISEIAKAFKSKFDVLIDAVYVKDMIKYEVFPSTIEGIGVNIGANGGEPPVFGDNVYIGPGAKIFGDIKIASGCRIGANAVVCKNCEEENSTLVGVPAKNVTVL